MSNSYYYTFGSPMPGRSYTNEQYRFAYQGSERDLEWLGGGISTDYRMLDPRLGRWFSTDPLTLEYQSPYNSMDNDPINLTDICGDNAEGGWEGLGEKPGSKISQAAQKVSGAVTTASLVVAHAAAEVYGQFAAGAVGLLKGLASPVGSSIGDTKNYGDNKDIAENAFKLGQAASIFHLLRGRPSYEFGTAGGNGGGAVSVFVRPRVAVAITSEDVVLYTKKVSAEQNKAGEAKEKHRENQDVKATPNENPELFDRKNIDGKTAYVNKETGEIFVKSHTSHGNKGNTGLQWKVYPKGTKSKFWAKQYGFRKTYDGEGNYIGK